MKAIVSLSGGMDSATVLTEAISRGREVHAVTFLYGSKHGRWEETAAARVATYYRVPHRYVDLSGAFIGMKSALMKTGEPIPEGHYEAANMSQTVVPGRNTIFTSVLLGVAQSLGAGEVWLGI